MMLAFMHLCALSDVDECSPTQLPDKYRHLEHHCHVDANCTNTKGSFYCGCHMGYSGDGVTCVGKWFELLTSLHSAPQIYLLNKRRSWGSLFQTSTNVTHLDYHLSIST